MANMHSRFGCRTGRVDTIGFSIGYVPPFYNHILSVPKPFSHIPEIFQSGLVIFTAIARKISARRIPWLHRITNGWTDTRIVEFWTGIFRVGLGIFRFYRHS